MFGGKVVLLCPPGMTRLDLLERLRPAVGGTVIPFDFPSKVPVPLAAGAGLPPTLAEDAQWRAMHQVAWLHTLVTALWRLAAIYARHERLLKRWLRTPPGFQSARPLPPAVITLLEAGRAQPVATLLPTLRRLLVDTRCGLNLYNVAHQRADKPTVELKLAAATLDPERALAVRALFVAMVQWTMGGQLDVPDSAAHLRRFLDLHGEFIPVLRAGAAVYPHHRALA